MEIISRAEAKAKGLTRYFTGRPCRHGHVCERAVGGCRCVECKKEYLRKYREANREKCREKSRRLYKANPEKEKERNRKYYVANPEKCAEKSRKYREANPEKRREWKRKYREANLEKCKERDRKYREANLEKCREKSRENYYHTKRKESALDTLALLANVSKLKDLKLNDL